MVSWALAPAGSVTAASKAAPANSERLMWSSPEFVASLVVIRMPDLPDKEKRREPLVRGAFRWASNYWRTNSAWQAAEVGERSEPGEGNFSSPKKSSSPRSRGRQQACPATATSSAQLVA